MVASDLPQHAAPPSGRVAGSAPDDPDRLRSLAHYPAAINAGDARLAALATAATVMLRCPMAVITLVGHHREVVLASAGDIRGAELVRHDPTFCGEAFRASDRMLLVTDPLQDDRFATSLLASGTFPVRFYAGAALCGREGLPLGLFCVLDVQPREFGHGDIATLEHLAATAAGILELKRCQTEQGHGSSAPGLVGASLECTCGPDGIAQQIVIGRDSRIDILHDLPVGQDWIALVHPLQQDEIRKRWLQAAGSRAPFKEQFRGCDRDGCPRWIEASLTPSVHADDTTWRGAFRVVDELDDCLHDSADPATHDMLTGLINRHRLQELLDRAMRDARLGIPLALLYLDLDDFKLVNDSLGHLAGDGLLRDVARRLLANHTRADIVCRLGGDEFLVVLLGVNHPDDVTETAQRIIKAIERPMLIEGQAVEVGISIGIALAPRDGATADLLMRNADLALYRAKQDGRGTACLFDPTMHNAVSQQREIRRGLSRALERQEFFLDYQPILSLPDGRVACLEALLRWRHPKRGIVAPSEFVPVAEASGLITPIGAWVLEQACRAAMLWPSDIQVAVNLSPRQFASGDVTGFVAKALKATGLAPGRLELEITETLPLLSNERNLSTLRRLRHLGVQVVLDDFGSGYSSLAYLSSFRFDKLKLDRTLIAAMGRRDGLLIARSIIRLATELGMEVTAEGIESAHQLQQVTDEGCLQAQGFHIGRPVAPTRIPRALPRIASRIKARVRTADATLM